MLRLNSSINKILQYGFEQVYLKSDYYFHSKCNLQIELVGKEFSPFNKIIIYSINEGEPIDLTPILKMIEHKIIEWSDENE